MTFYDNYSSPFSWRYASPEMRLLWSEKTKRLLWRKTWSALARAQVEFGLVSQVQAADIESHVEDINIERSLEIEAQIHHDLMAELRTFAEQCPSGKGTAGSAPRNGKPATTASGPTAGTRRDGSGASARRC